MQPLKSNSEDLAKYILAKVGEMSHLKLQKLLYYAQAWHLAILEEPLIDEDFEAWMHGPVCRQVWDKFKNAQTPLYGVTSLPEGEKEKVIAEFEGRITEDQVLLISDVLKEYGDKGDYHLECLTHSESPWINARGNTPAEGSSRAVISKESMREFYKQALYGSAKAAQ